MDERTAFLYIVRWERRRASRVSIQSRLSPAYDVPDYVRIRIPFRRPQPNRSVDGAIERFRRRRLIRPIVGIFIPPGFDRIESAVCGIRGSGKWMQVQSLAFHRQPISNALRDGCRAARDRDASWQETVGTGFDLGEACAEVCELVIANAGLSLEDVLVVSIDEPGVRWSDYDGRLEYAPLLQPQRLIERTGLNVIDSLPAADVAGGGRGGPLTPLAKWFLFSDRDQPIAECHRWVVLLDTQCTLIKLPPSDGLDAELPDIRAETLPGLGLLDELVRRADDLLVDEDVHGSLAVQGKSVPSLREKMQFNATSRPWEPWCGVDESLVAWMHDTTEEVDRLARAEGVPWPDVLCSATLALVDTIKATILSHNTPESEPIDMILAGRGNSNGLILSELQKITSRGEVHLVDQTGISSDALAATCAAVLGLMHIDQMPASVPWLTGSMIPRLHGRVTPGRPTHWRKLVTEMADYHPPAMKLRDAV